MGYQLKLALSDTEQILQSKIQVTATRTKNSSFLLTSISQRFALQYFDVERNSFLSKKQII